MFGRLNPCCSGQWSRTNGTEGDLDNLMRVLILIVVDDGLVRISRQRSREVDEVLILIVVDDGLVPDIDDAVKIINDKS